MTKNINGFRPLGNNAFAVVANGREIGSVARGTGKRWHLLSANCLVSECFEHTPKHAECLAVLAY